MKSDLDTHRKKKSTLWTLLRTIQLLNLEIPETG